MCRALMYLGKPILVHDLLYKTDSSLIKQAYDPKFMANFNNLAGFGMAAWSASSCNPENPYLYKICDIPFFDKNLSQLTKKIEAECLIAHVRGTIYSEKSNVIVQNNHPFFFEGCQLALAHNGDLVDFNVMKYRLLDWIRPEIAQKIQGTTDSEWIYAVLLSQLESPFQNPSLEAVKKALFQTIAILRKVRAEYGIAEASALNLFITNGKYLIATRFVLDFGCFLGDYKVDHLSYQSLWYTFGAEYGHSEGEYKMIGGEKNSSIMIASEPITQDVTTWIEVPEYAMISAQLKNDCIQIAIEDIGESLA